MLLPYAVSDGYYNMSLVTDKQNRGNSTLEKSCQPSSKTVCSQTTTIMLDDVLVYATDDKYIMKIDIEGHEIPALMSGKLFWEKLDISLIFMEWMAVPMKRKNGSIDDDYVIGFIMFMKKQGYSPYSDKAVKLETSKYMTWGYDIIWVKHNVDLQAFLRGI